MVRKLSVFTLFVLMAFTVHGAEVIELSTFRESADRVVQECYELAIAATKKGKALCDEQGFGDYWVCPPSKEIRLQALKQCKAGAQKAKDHAAMLYLLGLLHQDFHYQADNGECPEFYRFQEGSAVCVYTNDHFEQLIREFPKSKYSDMAAFKQADAAYRYYECEGQVLCSVENAICGWVDFLNKRPTSDLADTATHRIIESLNSLSGAPLDPRQESPSGLLGDVRNLRVIAAKLSSENRTNLTRSLDLAEAALTKLQKEK